MYEINLMLNPPIQQPNSKITRMFTLSFVLHTLADVAMMVNNEISAFFMVGLGLFLLGHVVRAVALSRPSENGAGVNGKGVVLADVKGGTLGMTSYKALDVWPEAGLLLDKSLYFFGITCVIVNLLRIVFFTRSICSSNSISISRYNRRTAHLLVVIRTSVQTKL